MASMHSILSLFLAVCCIYSTFAQSKNCSAIDSYVQITSPKYLKQTLSSGKALFTPYQYYIKPTQVVVLKTSDDVCSETAEWSTAVKNKIVLILPWHDIPSDCSEVMQVYVAQLHGARAVLLTDEVIKNVGSIHDIVDDQVYTSDGQLIRPSIP